MDKIIVAIGKIIYVNNFINRHVMSLRNFSLN